MWPLPAALRVILRWIADKLEAKCMVDLRCKRPVSMGKVFWADAKAEGDEVHIGGYELVEGGSLISSRWFSISLNRENAPWAYCKVGEAYRVIAALELFATLVCVLLLRPRTLVLFLSFVFLASRIT